MTDAERDPVVRRAIDELQVLPAVDPMMVKRIVAAAAVARVTPSDDEITLHPVRRHTRRWSIVGVAAAAAIAGFAVSTVWHGASPAPATEQVAMRASAPTLAPTVGSPATLSAAPMRSVASSDGEAMPIVQQFVFSSGSAHRVSVVGDFNRWNPASTPMSRASDGALWSVTIPLAPGRHVYGFMVDDSLMLDPRAPKTRDPDLGTDGSVVIVGRP